MEPAPRLYSDDPDSETCGEIDFDHMFGTIKNVPGRVVDDEYKPDLSALSKLDQRLLVETIARACERSYRMGYVVGSTPIPEGSAWSHRRIKKHFVRTPLSLSPAFFHYVGAHGGNPRIWTSVNRLRRFNPELCRLFDLDRED